MQQYTFKTSKSNTRPVIRIYENLSAVIDTGADIPVCSDANVLIERLGANEISIPGKVIETVGISGSVRGRIFRVKGFELGPLIYPELNFFVPDDPTMSSTFLLSASMFNGLICEVNFKDHYFRITLLDDEQTVRLVSFEKDGEHICWDVRKSE
ncbi:MAG: hypothetical protein IJU93_02835 [Lachnospiraceae bacterium]|nr:hypothetical protein [Lachnospiraceae bacterium]